MTSLGKDCYTENLTVNVLGSNSYPVQSIYRASTDYYKNDLNWIETDSGELRMRLKEDGHVQIVEGLELFHGTEDIRTATKQFSVGLNSTGGFVVRDEVNEVDVISISSGGQLNLNISNVIGLQSALDLSQAQFYTQGGLSVSTTVLDSFGLTQSGDGANYNRSLITAKALEDFIEGFQESLITVLPGQDSGHRISTITATPSSTNVPSALAVSNHVTSRLNSYTGDSGKAFTSSEHTLASAVKLASTSLSTQAGLQVTDVNGGSSFVAADDFVLSGTSIYTLLDGKQDAGDYVTTLSLGGIDTRLSALEADSYISTSGAGVLDGSLSVSGAVTVGGVLSAAALDDLDTRLDALEADSYISTSGAGVLDGSLSVSGAVTVGGVLSAAVVTATALSKDGVNVLDQTEVAATYATQAALSTYGGNSAIEFEAQRVVLDERTALDASTADALAIRNPLDTQYLGVRCSDVFFGSGASLQLTSTITTIENDIAARHPLTTVDLSAGGTLSSGDLITSGAVYEGIADLQSQIDGKQPLGNYLTAVPAGTNANLIANGSVNNTAFQYLAGVTSSIQTQLNNKSPLFSIDAVPTSGSSNLVTSGGVHNAINSVALVTPEHDGSLSVSGVVTAASLSIGTLTSNIAMPDISASLAIGFGAGTTQESFTIAIGSEAGQSQSSGGIAIGRRAGRVGQLQNAVAIGLEAARDSQGANTVAVGFLAAVTGQGDNSVAVGYLAGATVQGLTGVAVGRQAGSLSQGDGAIAVGGLSGLDSQGVMAVSIGNQSGFLSQGQRAVAIGQQSGRVNQGQQAVAVGHEAGRHQQGNYGVALGHRSGYLSQGENAVALGFNAGYNAQHTRSIIFNATGSILDSQQTDAFYVKPVREAAAASLLYYDSTTGEITHNDASYISTSGAGVLDGSLSVSGVVTTGSLFTTGVVSSTALSLNANTIALGLSTGSGSIYGVALGVECGQLTQGDYSLAIGYKSGQSNQGANAVAIGPLAANNDQGANSVAIGLGAGSVSQGASAVAFGQSAGYSDQAIYSVAIGQFAGQLAQAQDSVAIGRSAGSVSLGQEALALGYLTGNQTGARTISIGARSGTRGQDDSVAIGPYSGVDSGLRCTSVGLYAGGSFAEEECVALGDHAGYQGQRARAVAIGHDAGYMSQGAHAVAIGANAGYQSQHDRSIVLNATGAALNTQQADALYVKPVRESIGSYLMQYDTATNEVTYSNELINALSCGSAFIDTIQSSEGYHEYQTLGSQNILNAPANTLRLGGVNISSLNRRTRTSYAAALECVDTWTSRASAADQNWSSICYASELGLFVAVSSTGTSRVMTSPDAITWTLRTSSQYLWTSVCWSPELGVLCAVAGSGDGDRCMTSPDGVTWTLRSTPVNNFWTSVCWAAGLTLFVAVSSDGTGNRVMTSPDGITWTSRTSSDDNPWTSVCWSADLQLLAAVSNDGDNRVMTSPDGVTWTTRTTPNGGPFLNYSWSSICYAAELGLFTAVADTGQTGRVMTSQDGVTWTLRTSSLNAWSSICWADQLSLFVALASSGADDRVMSSPDGVNWSLHTSATTNSWQSICWCEELSIFAGVSSSGVGDRVMTSAIGMPNSRSVLKCNPAHLSVTQGGLVIADSLSVGSLYAFSGLLPSEFAGSDRVPTAADVISLVSSVDEIQHVEPNIVYFNPTSLFSYGSSQNLFNSGLSASFSNVTASGYLSVGSVYVDQVNILDEELAVGFGAAGVSSQGTRATALGYKSGEDEQSQYAVAVGAESGMTRQSAYATALGFQAGSSDQGAYSLALGAYAATATQGGYSICLNATGANLPCTIASSFVVKPMRNVQTSTNLHYNSTSGEVTYAKLHKGSWTVDSNGIQSDYVRSVTALFDDDTMMSTNGAGGGVITIPVTGKYTISHHFYLFNTSTTTDTSLRLEFFLNGTTPITAANQVVVKNNIATIIQSQSRTFTSGDTLQLRFVVVSGDSPGYILLSTDPSNGAATSFLSVIQIE